MASVRQQLFKWLSNICQLQCCNFRKYANTDGSRTFIGQEDRNSPHVLTEHLQTSRSYVSEPETPKMSEASRSSEVPTSGTQNETKKRVVGRLRKRRH